MEGASTSMANKHGNKPERSIWASATDHPVATCNHCLKSFPSNNRLHRHLREKCEKCPPAPEKARLTAKNTHPADGYEHSYSSNGREVIDPPAINIINFD